MSTDKVILVAVILATASLDALRDAWWGNPRFHKGTPWDSWHVVKRGALYLPLAALIILGRFGWLEIISLLPAGAVIWAASMRAGGKDWPLFGAWRNAANRIWRSITK